MQGGETGNLGRYVALKSLSTGISRHAAPFSTLAPRARASRRLLLRRLELDQARDTCGAAVVNQAERVHRPVRLAHRKHGLGQRVKIARIAQLFGDFRLHR